MGKNTRSGLGWRGSQPAPAGGPLQDPEFWQPRNDPQWSGRPGRPRKTFNRTLDEFPAPTPQPTPCVLWQGPVDRYGYGVLSGRGHGSGNHHKRIRAHRWVWEMHNSELLPGLVVRHKCDNRVCINLDHLELGTQGDNVRDAAERGHLGAVRVLTPSQVREIAGRRAAGETWASIHKDFGSVSLTSVRMAVKYAADL